MVKTLSTLAVFALVGFAADSAQAQGCCKAGLCRIPSIPSTSAAASMSMLQPQIDAQMASRAMRPMTNGATVNGDTATLAQLSLSNPSGSQSGVEYVLDGKTYMLEPGMTLTFNTSQARKIEFKRGTGDNMARYRVSRGSYEFGQTQNGWELYRLAAR